MLVFELVVVREGLKPRKRVVVLVFGAGGCQKVVETLRMSSRARSRGSGGCQRRETPRTSSRACSWGWSGGC